MCIRDRCYTHGWLYYILDGLAKVYISTSDGNEQIIDFMKQDTLIGMDCIDDENKSVVSITSVVDMHVLPFTADILKKLILQNPQLGYDLVVYYGEVLREVAFMVGSLGHSDQMLRLTTFLLLLLDTPEYRDVYKRQLFLGAGDLLGGGGHFIPLLQADQLNLLGAQTHGGESHVHSHVAAAADQHFLADLLGHKLLDFYQEVQAELGLSLIHI